MVGASIYGRVHWTQSLVVLLIIKSSEAAHFYLMPQVQCWIGPIWFQGGKLLNAKTKLRVVWIVYDPRRTPSFNTLTGLLIKIDPMNHEKTHVFLPGDRSLELCQTEHVNSRTMSQLNL